MDTDRRPDPDELLQAVSRDEEARRSARLRLFLGMSAGVGKTYAMLKAAHHRKAEGLDIVIGLVETHGRKETAALLEGLEIVPRRTVMYRETRFEELDVDAILARRPQIVVVDELAHTNAPGSRHAKRYQDVLELLDAGIDVYAALNVQHLESRKDSVEAITQISIRETVPDSIIERANQVELVDIAPPDLLKRLKEGKVYLGENAARAAQNFFREDKLTALREIALRLTAERVDQDLQRLNITRAASASPWQTNERLMVAVSHSPYSEKLIRATRRLAYNLEAPWIAVHVDTGLTLDNDDQLQLAKNLSLARELKAEVIATTDTDIAPALHRIARQKNVTQILVGRPSRRWLRDTLEGGTLLDRLVRESLDVDVHVIRQDGVVEQQVPFQEKLRRFRLDTAPISYWNTLWFMIGVSIAGAVLSQFAGYRAVGFIYLLAVMVVGLVGPLGPVIFAAVLSVFAWNYLFIPPRFTFAITEPEDVIMCFSYVFTAIAMGSLTSRIRFHERLLREREERTSLLYEVLQDIANNREPSDYLAKVCYRVSRLLNADCGVFLADGQGKLNLDDTRRYAIALDEKSQAVATWAFESQKSAGWSTDTLANADALYLPLKASAEKIGLFVFRPKRQRRLSAEQENLLHSVVRQLAVSLERDLFERRLQESRRFEESEKLHQTLLNSISHEMRTPLTAILGWASSLDDVSRDPAKVRAIGAHLMESGERLNRVIENLLDMSRLSSGVLALKKEWYDIEDLIGVTLKKLGRSITQHPVRTRIAPDLPMVKIDFRFMEHAISNLVVNAASYAPQKTEITIWASSDDGVLKIGVDDLGPGVPVESASRIFEKFYRVPGTPAGGTGLGLSIVRSIVEAHGGRVDVGRNPEGGARFTIELPAVEQPPSAPEVP